MRLFALIAGILVASVLGFSPLPAAAQTFPSDVKNCKRDTWLFERGDGQFTVPDVNGGSGVVQRVSQNYVCELRRNGAYATAKIYGLKDAAGTLIIPYRYLSLMPFSTTGALVKVNDKYRTYIVGRGESREQYEFDDVKFVTPPTQCYTRWNEGITVLMGQNWAGTINGVGPADVTLFSPSGQPRELRQMGGEGLVPAVQRVGDVFRARWRDETGIVRTGLIDLSGNRVSPVLASTHEWSTLLAPSASLTSRPHCSREVSYDLLLEGPSLDRDPTKIHYGPLYTLIDRSGSPTPMPTGAIGVIPVYRVSENSNRRDQRNNTTTWAVVFPSATGWEFTLHVGPPGEALIAAHTGARYSEFSWTSNGWLLAKAARDGRWRLFRHLTDIPVGQPNSAFQAALDSGAAVINAENTAQDAVVAAEFAAKEAERQAQLKRSFEAARGSELMCHYILDASFSTALFEEYLNVCGPDNYPTFRQLAAAKGITPQQMTDAIGAISLRRMAQASARMRWEEEARIRRMQNANQSPGASYFPGQWESAIRNAGNAAVSAINKSSDDWQQKRRDDYIADWQRSQRAY